MRELHAETVFGRHRVIIDLQRPPTTLELRFAPPRLDPAEKNR
jgi:hypothetical protein